MSEDHTVVFTAGANTRADNSWGGTGSLWVDPGHNAGYAKIYAGTQQTPLPNFWALVLDRRDPTKQPLLNLQLTSNTDVPPQLSALLTPEHLLFFYAAYSPYQMPQGALFDALSRNGAGAQLHRLERLAYFNGCGMSAYSLYMLVSVPGTGMPGFEFADFTRSANTFDYKATPQGYLYGYTFPKHTMLISLLPGPDGYSPLEIGGS